MADTKAEYFVTERWKYFVSLADQDKQFREYRDFLARAEEVIDDLPSEQRFAASGFLSEVEKTLREKDPLTSPERLMPQIRDPRPDDLKPYLGSWSPYGPEGY